MDLSYCNGQKLYDFSTDPGFNYLGCNPMKIHINDLSPLAFRRGYVAALFAKYQRWLADIEKHRMVVPGSPKNTTVHSRDLAVKTRLQEQVSPSTYEDRKAYYKAWQRASCCAEDCDQYCDVCPNKGIQFNSIPANGLDADVRRFITKFGRYQTASELGKEYESGKERSSTTVFSGVHNGKSDNDPIRVREQKRGGLPCESEEVPSDQAERIEALLSHPFSEEMVT